MATIIETKLFSFSELSAAAKSAAIETIRNSESYLSWEWYASVKEDFHQILNMIGFYDIDSTFSGFWEQGDGASFTGRYSYEKGCLRAVKAYAPKDEKLHELVESIVTSQKPHFYKLQCVIYSASIYCHAHTMQFEWTKDGNYFDWQNDQEEDEIEDTFRGLANWYYEKLESEYDYFMSDDAIADYIEAHERRFTEDGQEA